MTARRIYLSGLLLLAALLLAAFYAPVCGCAIPPVPERLERSGAAAPAAGEAARPRGCMKAVADTGVRHCSGAVAIAALPPVLGPVSPHRVPPMPVHALQPVAPGSILDPPQTA